MSQQRLADLIGITQAALSNYETGKRDLPLATFVKLASALDAPLGDLLGLTPRKPRRPRTAPARTTGRTGSAAWNGRGSSAEAAS